MRLIVYRADGSPSYLYDGHDAVLPLIRVQYGSDGARLFELGEAYPSVVSLFPVEALPSLEDAITNLTEVTSPAEDS